MAGRSFLIAIFLVWTATVTGVAGCSKRGATIEVELPDGTREKLQAADTLRINIGTEPPTLDWNKAADTTSATIIGNMMEGLTRYDLTDKELGLKPALALKWEPSERAQKWKITLRDGVTWNDGRPFTTKNVTDGWRRLLAKETASEYAYFLFALKNARAFNEGKATWDEVGVKTTGPLEISVELDKPMSYFPYLLTHHSTFPVRADIVQKYGNRWTDPGKIVTLGAFNLKSWSHDKMISLERNEKYYDEKPSFKNIAAYMIQEQATAINLFDSGRLDSIHDLPSVELRTLRNRKEFRSTGSLQLYYYGVNVTKPPMNNPLVRRAVSMAIDRQQIVQMLAGGQMPMTSWVPPGMFGYEANRGLGFNPQKARELLMQAGFKDPAKFPKLEIKFNTSEDHQRIAENIQSQLKQNLGIDVELKNEEWKVFLNTLKTDPPQLYRFGWAADYPDPDNFMSVIASFSDNNRTRWKNPKYDELVLRGAGAIDRDERRKIYGDAQKILVEEDVPVIPLFSSVNTVLVANRVENYPMNVMKVLIYKGVKLK